MKRLICCRELALAGRVGRRGSTAAAGSHHSRRQPAVTLEWNDKIPPATPTTPRGR